MANENQHLTPGQAAAILNVSPRTLQSWRCKGIGPVYLKLTPKVVRYPLATLRAFEQANLRSRIGG